MTREQSLYDASLCGSVESLNQLMYEDELLLDRISITCFDKTPLHVAATQGHLDFAGALLSYKRGFVRKLDSHGCSPLHLASENGHVEMVKFLLHADSDVCLIRNEDGRTPLHLAVINGHIDIIKELVQGRPEVIPFTLNRGETILHCCVIYDRLDVLKLFMESGWVNDMANLTDDNGDTIWHMATILKRVQMIKYLLSRNEVEVDAVNANGFTVLDIIHHMPKDMKIMEIYQLLASSEASRASERLGRVIVDSNHQRPPAANLQPPPCGVSQYNSIKKYLKKKCISMMNKQFMKQERKPWFRKKADALMVAASVIAAMAYQAAISPPGGVFDQEVTVTRNGVPWKFDPGTSKLSSIDPRKYKKFCLYNTTAFIASISIIFMFVCGSPVRRRILSRALTAAMWVTVTAKAATYNIGIKAITPAIHSLKEYHFEVGIIVKTALYTWLGAAAVGVLFFSFHVIVCTIRRKQKKSAKKRISRNAVSSG